jgi:hypothetical protein
MTDKTEGQLERDRALVREAFLALADWLRGLILL